MHCIVAGKVAMNLLRHLCGIATRTAEMVDKVRAVSPIPILVTRKHLPESRLSRRFWPEAHNHTGWDSGSSGV